MAPVIYEMFVEEGGTWRSLGFVEHDSTLYDDICVVHALFRQAGYEVGMTSHNGPKSFPGAHFQLALWLRDRRHVPAEQVLTDFTSLPQRRGAFWPIDDPRPPGQWR